MSELFFDTETTGLCHWNLPHDDPCQPDVIQLAAVLATEEGEIAHLSTLINPPWPWSMSAETEAVHGFGRERIEAEGQPTPDVMTEFLGLAARADTLICHNVQFDAKLMRTALHRCGFHEGRERFVNSAFYCTMKRSTNLCRLPGRYGFKWPKLVELHEHLFGEGFEGAHDALNDVRATARCFYEMRRRGL